MALARYGTNTVLVTPPHLPSMAPDAGPPGIKDYPLQIGLAYLFLVGYIMRTIFVSVGLPASVGVIITGFSFSFFFQVEVLAARDELQQLAFFLVLLTAGLEIRLRDLRLFIFVMAFLPAILEISAIAGYAVVVLKFSYLEGVVMGTILVGIGDGLVIPKMKEFGVRFDGHPMPRLLFIWAPLEASFALTLFGVLMGFSTPKEDTTTRISVIAGGNLLRIIATVMLGALLGTLSGYLVSKRTGLSIRGNQIFTGSAVEAFLMVLAVGLFAFGLGDASVGGTQEMIPLGFIQGSLFQPELAVIMTGMFFAAAADRQVLHDVEHAMGGVWIFGQIILFSMLGSRTPLDIFPQFLDHVFPIIVVGLLARFIGVYCSIHASIILSLPGHPFQRSMVLQDASFCFLSTVPRATIQGALGQVPVTDRFFQSSRKNATQAQDFIFMAARLYIVFMSIVGMILLNLFGPILCEATKKRPAWFQEEELAKETDSTPSVTGQSVPDEDRPQRMISEPSFLPDVGDGPVGRPPARFKRQLGIHHHLGPVAPDLDMVQFDCPGSVLKMMAAKQAQSWRREETEPTWGRAVSS